MQSGSIETHATVDYSPIRESRFADALSGATEAQDKSAFNLILAMLTQDATELDQFHLPKSEQPELKSEIKSQFNVRERPLYGHVNINTDLNNGIAINEGRKQDVVLDLCLNPQPLVKEQYDLSSEVFDNLDFNARQRLLSLAAKEDKKMPTDDKAEEKQIDVETWFNVLHQSRVYANAVV